MITKGSIVLGQEQDGYKTKFDSTQALQGNITSVNLWSRVLLPGEVSALATTCPTIEGDIVQWSALMTKAAGMAKLVCSTYCSESLPCVPTGKSYKCVSCGGKLVPL